MTEVVYNFFSDITCLLFTCVCFQVFFFFNLLLSPSDPPLCVSGPSQVNQHVSFDYVLACLPPTVDGGNALYVQDIVCVRACVCVCVLVYVFTCMCMHACTL